MKQVKILDTTLCREETSFSFKEKIEIARQLERLCVDTIEIPEIENAKTDILFVKTVSAFVKKAVLSVAAGSSRESIENAALALSAAEKGRIRIEQPVSAVSMEYTCHKKAPKMLEWVKEAVKMASEKCADVEFCAVDATRAEKDFLMDVIAAAVESGATSICICDTAAEMMPDDFAAFAEEIKNSVGVPVSVSCENKNGLANAAAVLSLKKGIDGVKTAVGNNCVNLETFATMMRNCGENFGIETSIRYTELYRIVKQIDRIVSGIDSKAVVTVSSADESIRLDENDSCEDVSVSVKKLGYDLSAEDEAKVYEEFLRVAQKKTVGAKELDAIVASVALQVPATYKLISYVVNSGNIISANAQITLEKNGQTLQDICIGDGPIDAAFLAIDKIIGHHYELDDFQIQSVTEGKEAMGSAVVKLRAGSKVYSGNGISTDIIGASIRAYLSAVNKIIYEEA